MATLVDRVAAERLDVARSAAVAAAGLLKAVTVMLYVVGWLTARVARVVWAVLSVVVWPAVTWSVAAVRVGWREGWQAGRGG